MRFKRSIAWPSEWSRIAPVNPPLRPGASVIVRLNSAFFAVKIGASLVRDASRNLKGIALAISAAIKFGSVTPLSVPEPATLGMAAMGAGVLIRRRRGNRYV